MTIEVIDPVKDYAELMETLFDFDAIAKMFKGGFRMWEAPLTGKSARSGRNPTQAAIAR